MVEKTNDATNGGIVQGKSHEEGGVKGVIITDNNRPIEVEGGEAIINKEAVKKYWKILNKINTITGGNPILNPNIKYQEGGTIDNQSENDILQLLNVCNIMLSTELDEEEREMFEVIKAGCQEKLNKLKQENNIYEFYTKNGIIILHDINYFSFEKPTNINISLSDFSFENLSNFRKRIFLKKEFNGINYLYFNKGKGFFVTDSQMLFFFKDSNIKENTSYDFLNKEYSDKKVLEVSPILSKKEYSIKLNVQEIIFVCNYFKKFNEFNEFYDYERQNLNLYKVILKLDSDYFISFDIRILSNIFKLLASNGIKEIYMNYSINKYYSIDSSIIFSKKELVNVDIIENIDEKDFIIIAMPIKNNNSYENYYDCINKKICLNFKKQIDVSNESYYIEQNSYFNFDINNIKFEDNYENNLSYQFKLIKKSFTKLLNEYLIFNSISKNYFKNPTSNIYLKLPNERNDILIFVNNNFYHFKNKQIKDFHEEKTEVFLKLTKQNFDKKIKLNYDGYIYLIFYNNKIYLTNFKSFIFFFESNLYFGKQNKYLFYEWFFNFNINFFIESKNIEFVNYNDYIIIFFDYIGFKFSNKFEQEVEDKYIERLSQYNKYFTKIKNGIISINKLNLQETEKTDIYYVYSF
ncbi:MAG: hypothetical protein QXM96_00750 [Candidatus Woesearchaeota archaeon]